MGHVFVYGRCIGCARPIAFNPNKVPSVRLNGVREPMCHGCATMMIKSRKAAGQQYLDIDPEAYQPLNENDL